MPVNPSFIFTYITLVFVELYRGLYVSMDTQEKRRKGTRSKTSQRDQFSCASLLICDMRLEAVNHTNKGTQDKKIN